VLGVGSGDASELLDLAWHLEVNLPGTKAAFDAGILSRDKAAVVAYATAYLDPAEARAAEAMVLDRAGSLTPAPGGPLSGVILPGFAGRVTLTIPATTVLDLADRPGEMAGIGPIDPNPGANTLDRYQTGHQPTRYPAHQRTGPPSPQGQ
jgi:hypothetical protein